MFEVASTVAVVTGGGSGIGRAASTVLAAAGTQVAVADLRLEAAEETVAGIAESGGTATAFYVDVGDVAAVRELREQVRAKMGTAAILVNNAGWDRTMPFVDTEPEFWRKVVDVNYLGAVAMAHTFLPDMITEGDGGRLVNVASDAGRVGSLGETVYAGAKGGVIAFTKSLARETARHQITVNCVCPGPTDTPLFHEQSAKVRKALIGAIPFRRLGRPEEVAAAIAFFASSQASYMTGQVVSVSGGLTMAG